uniref:Uncharacterized protein n=1 Tax=Strongyloides papillosus TaxID=174720 RepID=A0A0N5BFE7_STREA
MKLFTNVLSTFFVICITIAILNAAPNKEKKLERKKKHEKNINLENDRSITSTSSDGIANHLREQKNSISEKPHHHKHSKKDRRIKNDKKIKNNDNKKNKERKNKKKCNCKNKKDKKRFRNKTNSGKEIN